METKAASLDQDTESLKLVFRKGIEITNTKKVPKLDEKGVVILGEHEEKKIVLGRGLLETQLKELGYEKRELKKYAHMGLLRKVTVKIQGGWRNCYVLLDSLVKELNAGENLPK